MNILDIILISLGVIAVVIYLILNIKKTNSYNKKFQQFIDKGLTENQAKTECDKLFSKQKKKKQEDENEEDIWEE